MLKWLFYSLLFLIFISLDLSAQQIIRANTSVNTPNEEPGAIRVSAEGLGILGGPVFIQEAQEADITARYPISSNLRRNDIVVYTVTGGIISSGSTATAAINNTNLQFLRVIPDLALNSSSILFRVLDGGVPAGSILDLTNLRVGNIIQPNSVGVAAHSELVGGVIFNVVPSLETQGVPTQGTMTVTYQVTIDIQEGDRVTFTFNGATLDKQNVPTLVDTIDSNSDFSFEDIVNSADSEFPSSMLTFLAPQGGLIVDDFRNLVLANVLFDRIINPGEVSLSANTSVLESDVFFNEADPTIILDIRSQFSVGEDSDVMNRRFNSVIDLDNMRQQFVAASDPGAVTNGSTREPESIVRDDFFVSIDSAQTDLLNTIVTSVRLSLTGEDLSFLLDAEGSLDSFRFDVTGLERSKVGATGEDAPSIEGDTLTVATANDPGGYVGIALLPEGVNNNNFTQLSPQRFLVDLEIRYALAGVSDSVDRNDINAGAWILNGTTLNIPFMPYGPAINQAIVISNDGNLSGSIELMAFNSDGEKIGPITLSEVATANTVTNISVSIREALEDELGDDFDANGAEFDITLFVNALSANIDMSANYRVNNDRVGVIVIKE